MRVSHAWRRAGSTQASWAREPQRCRRLGLGLFSAGDRARGDGQCRGAGEGRGPDREPGKREGSKQAFDFLPNFL